ncbi:hypothetical protein [Rhodococcus phenolicus]|uniref:hypothetical protein n=1 Tax=Rhodococcus phenolicus TaxID=263849 RepID=UPI000B2CABAC|nr:hypothetical protein [Rhodococcus phenolicus]
MNTNVVQLVLLLVVALATVAVLQWRVARARNSGRHTGTTADHGPHFRAAG